MQSLKASFALLCACTCIMDQVVLFVAAAMLLYVLIAVRKEKQSPRRKKRKRTRRSGGGDDEESGTPRALGGEDLIYAIGLYLIILAVIVYLVGWAITGNSGWTAALGL